MIIFNGVMAAILDLKVKTRSNHKINIKYVFLIPKNIKNHILHETVGQTVKKINFIETDGGHFGFWVISPLKL